VLTFVGNVCGKTEEAIHFYGEVFKNAPGAATEKPTTATVLARYGKAEPPEKEGSVRYASFTLLGQEFGAMDSARSHNLAFSEAISFMVPCDSQQEIDYFWEKLAADPHAGQCGWLKDKYGLSWQVTPTALNELLSSGGPQRTARVTQAFLKMKKFDIAALRRASKAK
jgi:predicted 3-demethylubiquinone-9 3-methyltransferase (glyoxalase superfamily)